MKQTQELPRIGAPAKRALAGVGVIRMEQLTKYTEAEIAELHGVGPKAIRILKQALKEKGVHFK